MQWSKFLRALIFIWLILTPVGAVAAQPGLWAGAFPLCPAGSCATVDLDFVHNRYYIAGAAGALSTLTFTRASTATCYNNQLLLTTYGSGVARTQCYNPANGLPLGYLAETASTNTNVQSNNFLTSWNLNGQATPTAAGVITPDGTSGAYRLTENTANSVHEIFQGLSNTSGTTYTHSAILKAGTATWATVAFFDSANAYGTFFDLQNGVVGGSGGGFTAPTRSGMQSLGNGWYRCWVTSTAVATGGNVFMGVAQGNNVRTYLGTGNYILAYNSQQEAQQYPTSVIVTTTATATRAADSLILPVATGSWYVTPAWTTISELYMPQTTAGVSTITQRPWEFSDGTAANRYAMDNAANSPALNGFAEGNGNLIGTANLGNIVTNSVFRAAYRVNGLNYSGTLSAGTIQSTNYIALSSPITRLLIGNNFSFGAALNGYTRRLTYIPTNIPDATMQNLTKYP